MPKKIRISIKKKATPKKKVKVNIRKLSPLRIDKTPRDPNKKPTKTVAKRKKPRKLAKT